MNVTHVVQLALQCRKLPETTPEAFNALIPLKPHLSSSHHLQSLVHYRDRLHSPIYDY